MEKLVQHVNRYKFVLSELVKKGIKLRYRRSYLGIFWSMLEPLLNMIVLYFVFGALLGRSNNDYGGLHFMIYILSGRLIYTCFNQSTKECTRIIRKNAALIKKVYIPKYLFPLSDLMFNFFLFLVSLLVLVIVSVVLMICGVQPVFNLFALQFIIPLINLFLLTLGVSLIVATIGVFFRDMEYLWTIATTLIMYMSAIFYYPLQLVGNNPNDWKIKLIELNPLYCIISNFRNCIFGDPFDSGLFLYSLIFSLVCIVIGVFAFFKKQDKFILEI